MFKSRKQGSEISYGKGWAVTRNDHLLKERIAELIHRYGSSLHERGKEKRKNRVKT